MGNIFSYYINGTWEKSKSGQTIKLNTPYSNEEVGSVQAITQEEVDFAIKSAKKAQVSWADLELYKRADYLFKWAEALLEMKEELATVVMREVGKSYKDALKEVERTAELIKYTVEDAIHMSGESMSGGNFPSGSSSKLAVVERVPLGVVLAIAPFNYPINLAAAKIAPALIMGNTVIFKPATQGAISGVKMVEALHRAGLPKGVLQLVTGKGSVIGDYLVEHEGIDMISFTGGTGTGERIAKKAGMLPMVMELGGKDPAIVSVGADLELTAQQIVAGAYSYSGQRCTAIKRVLVDNMVADELILLMKKEIEKLKVGSPEDNATVVPLIDSGSADFVYGLIDDAVSHGASVVLGGKREGNLIYPTLLDNVTEYMRVAWEEPFGPVLPVIRVSDMDEAVDLANKSEFGLQASVFTKDISEAVKISRNLETGTVQINGRTERGPDHFPFIGVKKSGLGAQGVRRSLESMSREKVMVINI